MEAQIERAIDLGMKSLCITDHQDFDAPPFPPDYFKFLLNDVGDDDTTAAYVADLTALKEKYQDKIELLIGIELGIQPHITETVSYTHLDVYKRQVYMALKVKELLQLQSLQGFKLVSGDKGLDKAVCSAGIADYEFAPDVNYHNDNACLLYTSRCV